MDLEASKTLYKEFMADWLNDKKIKVKRRTLETYSGMVNNHILPALGELKMFEITPRHIQNLYNDLHQSKKLSGENIQKVHTIINESLKKAVGWNMIIKNPADVVDRPKAEKTEMMYWLEEESHRFLKGASADSLLSCIPSCAHNRYATSEILGLRWSDIDIKARTISVSQTLNHYGKELEQGTKTQSGMRSIGIDKVTASERTARIK